jgi:flagellar FliL protein
MADETTNPKPEVKKSKGIPLALVLPLVLVLIAAGAGGAYFFLHRAKSGPVASSEPAAAAAPESGPEFTLRLDSFTVNLADPDNTNFLRVTIDLGLGHTPKGGGGKDDQSLPISRTRDAILSVLAVSKSTELVTPDGKAQLKQHLLDTLQQSVPELDVKNIYFTEFLVQR